MKRRVLCCFMALLMMVLPLAGAQAAGMPAAQPKAASSGAITALKVSANPMAGEKISFFVRLNRGGRLLMKIMDAETGKVLSQFYNKSRSRGSVKMAFSGRLGDGSTLAPGKRYLVRAVPSAMSTPRNLPSCVPRPSSPPLRRPAAITIRTPTRP